MLDHAWWSGINALGGWNCAVSAEVQGCACGVNEDKSQLKVLGMGCVRNLSDTWVPMPGVHC